MRRLSGIRAADGIAFGHAFVSDRRRIQVPRRHLAPEEVEPEVARLRSAIETTDQQLQRIKEKIYRAGGQEHTLILQAHQLILKDVQLVEQTESYIREELINAEWALRRTVREVKQLFDQIEDDYFRERRSDVDFVADHLMVTLTGARQVKTPPPPESVVVAHDIAPADIARLYRTGIKALVTEVGGRTSHTAIVARSLGIPAVVAAKSATDIIGSGDALIVDGYRGEVLCSPDEESIRRYQRRARRRAAIAQGWRRERELPAETQDGVRVHLMANIELSDEIPGALSQGAEGIGLYRTEFLYLGRETLPGEEEHLRDARQVLSYSRGVPVTFRTCDLGADKVPGGWGNARQTNPSLGLRSIRLCLERPEIFRPQLRGLMRAAAYGNVRIMFPMISGIEEFRAARAVFDECRAELEQEGVQTGRAALGVMIEMPSAAVTADLLAREVDFFSIGTNDLTQYALAVDRVNDQVNYLFQPCHPAILRLICQVVEAGERAGIPVTVCGEMAGDPLMTLVLLGLGVRQLSMNALSVPQVKRIIRAGSATVARALAARALALGTSEQVEAEIMETMEDLYPDLHLSSADELDEDTIF